VAAAVAVAVAGAGAAAVAVAAAGFRLLNHQNLALLDESRALRTQSTHNLIHGV
jgi:hypothetical protein